jgi:hypothetical protein
MSGAGLKRGVGCSGAVLGAEPNNAHDIRQTALAAERTEVAFVFVVRADPEPNKSLW